MEQKNRFEYTYSAPTPTERAEIEGIRSGYVKKEPTDLDRLRTLDKKVKNLPTFVSLLMGILGTLIAGLGMSMFMVWDIQVWGIVVGIVGCIPVALAYPSYQWILNRQKEKYGNEILELSDRLLNGTEGKQR